VRANDGDRHRTSFFPSADGSAVILVSVEDTGEGPLHDQVRFDTALAEICADLVAVTPEGLDAAIHRTLGLVGRRKGLDRILIHVADSGIDQCHLEHLWTREGTRASGRPEPALSPGSCPWVWERTRAGQTVVVNDVEELPAEAERERGECASHGAAAFVSVPLESDGEVFGTITFACRTPRAWGETLTSRMQLVARMVGSALSRERLRREAENLRRLEELAGELAGRFVDADAETIDEAIAGALEIMREALGARRALISEFDWSDETLVALFEAGMPGALRPGERVPIDSLPARLRARLEAGENVVVAERTLPDFVQEPWQQRRLDTGVIVPLHIGGEYVGGIVLAYATQTPVSARALGYTELVRRLFGHALARRRAERRRAEAYAELAALKAKIERERDYLREEVEGAHGPLVAESRAMAQVLDAVRAVAPTDATVLVQGETGAGKEVVARQIHAASHRADGPLVKVNCASIPRELFESEFFGHVRGAFTGATRDRRGRFELAEGGTVFLDEVGEIPLELQAKLLRVLQEHELERVGDDRTRRVDVRVIAATNRDLAEEVAEGRFRADLYYRLSVFPIAVPPLRERVEDIAPLARSFLARHAAATHRTDLELSPSDLQRLESYEWPGNIRELSHVIERAVILSAEPPLRLDLATAGRATPPSGHDRRNALASASSTSRVRTVSELQELERGNILLALERAGKVAGRGGAAELLEMSPSTLRDRMKSLGIAWKRGSRGSKAKGR
jgi:transcriptional regulator with GAF, ATPase, and Fis domain